MGYSQVKLTKAFNLLEANGYPVEDSERTPNTLRDKLVEYTLNWDGIYSHEQIIESLTEEELIPWAINYLE